MSTAQGPHASVVFQGLQKVLHAIEVAVEQFALVRLVIIIVPLWDSYNCFGNLDSDDLLPIIIIMQHIFVGYFCMS